MKNMLVNNNILGFDVVSNDIGSVIDYGLSDSAFTKVINTINPHSYVEQKKDKGFKAALKSSDVLVPDGSGIVLAFKLLHNLNVNKIAGFDLFNATCQRLNENAGKNAKVFFLGSTEAVLEKMESRMKQDYPNIEVHSYSPPYKSKFNDEDIDNFVDVVNAFMPDVLFVGLTAPKQEKLILEMREKLNAKFAAGIGAVFDFYAGTVRRPAKVWIKLHLEWLVRLLGEPKRLWRRNFLSTPIFLKDLLLAKFKELLK